MKLELQQDEQVVAKIHKHWLVFFGYLLLIAIIALLPLIVLKAIPQGAFSVASANFGAPVLAFGYFAWLLILWVLLFGFWTTFYLDIWIITDYRIIDIDQRGLFSRDMATTWLEKLQDVEVEVTGIFQTLFGFGTIKIYTAGENPNIIITNAAHPYEAREALLRSQHKAEVAVHSPGAE